MLRHYTLAERGNKTLDFSEDKNGKQNVCTSVAFILHVDLLVTIEFNIDTCYCRYHQKTRTYTQIYTLFDLHIFCI